MYEEDYEESYEEDYEEETGELTEEEVVDGLRALLMGDNLDCTMLDNCNTRTYEDGGYLTFSTDVGMEAALKATYGADGKIDMDATLERPTFNWIDNGGSKSIKTDSFLLYLYDTDESAESPYAGAPAKTAFSDGSYQLPLLKTLVKR